MYTDHVSVHRLSVERAESAKSDAKRNSISENLTEKETQEYRALFDLFDPDQSGTITAIEFADATKALGLQLSQKEIDDMMKEVDDDGDGTIDFEEFCVVMQKMSSKRDSWEEVIKQCYEVFDRNDTGSIRESAFEQILREIGGIENEELIDELFNQADVDGNGVIDYEEFSSFCRDYLTEEDVESSPQY